MKYINNPNTLVGQDNENVTWTIKRKWTIKAKKKVQDKMLSRQYTLSTQLTQEVSKQSNIGACTKQQCLRQTLGEYLVCWTDTKSMKYQWGKWPKEWEIFSELTTERSGKVKCCALKVG